MDVMYQDKQGLMQYRGQIVVFRKDDVAHIARIITCVDIKKGKLKPASLLICDFDMDIETVIEIYRRRWQIESLFRQIKQNFPLRYFYGESANTIKIQIWVNLVANLLLTLLQRRLKRFWSFSRLAAIVRIVLMYYINLEAYLNDPDKGLRLRLADAASTTPNPSLFD